MKETNPYIVREEELYTIQQFVTGRPLTDEEMLPDSHGIHPVSPLGFMMKEDGTTLGQAGATTGFVPYPADDDPGTAYDNSYVVNGKYYMYEYDRIAFPVLSVVKDEGNLVIVVNGLMPDDEIVPISFRNATDDDYEPTGIVGGTFASPTVVPNENKGTTTVTVAAGDIAFDGTVGDGKLVMCVETSKKYLTVNDPDSDEQSGIYLVPGQEGMLIRKVYSYPIEQGSEGELGDCYASNGYSDKEVADWVLGRIERIVRHACHPYSDEYELTNAGAFTRWFVTDGDVDIAGGVGGSSVPVRGFGLGSGYGERVPYGEIQRRTADEEDGAVCKWITFGYGAKHDAFQVDVGKTALPLDWPFTNSSSYADASLDNSITLIRDGAELSDGTIVGRMLRHSDETCDECGGTGELTITCPSCNGTGTTRDEHQQPYECPTCSGTGTVIKECHGCHGTGKLSNTVLMNRVHVCLYNDFSPSDSTHGHTAKTTVLKKTFVNLATPITEKDGDEFEVTVSLPAVNHASAYAGDLDMNLSGYYAYISQPRVYVVSGTWEFSETRTTYTATKESATVIVSLDKPLLDKDGNELDDVDVKVKLLFSGMRGRKFSALGHLSGTDITVTELETLPDAIARKLDTTSGISGSICGAAYVPENNGTLENVKTRLGLNAVRHTDGMLGQDYGSATDGALDEFNKFYTVRNEDGSPRVPVLKDSEGKPLDDQRQVVATVYPTTTNTFQWGVTGRRKMAHLDKLMTMAADAGLGGIFARVYGMNRRVYNTLDIGGSEAMSQSVYPMDMTRDIYGLQPFDSFIGAVLSVTDPSTIDTNGDTSTTYPVRRAAWAARLLASDFRNARMSRIPSVPDYAGDIKKDDSGVDEDYTSFGDTVSVPSDANDYEKMAFAVRLRHIPKILASAGTDETGLPYSPVLDCYPFKGDDYEYQAGNPYMYGDYDTTGRTAEVPCEVADSSDTEAFGQNNSLVKACISNGYNFVSDTDKVDDMVRAAELEAVDFSDTEIRNSIIYPDYMRIALNGWFEPISAFAKIISPDNAPAPSRPEQPEEIEEYLNLPDDQLEFISYDAYSYYRHDGWDPARPFIATTMPTNDSLAMFLKSYIPGYASGLAARNWDSFRVKVTESPDAGSLDEDAEITYYTRLKWSDADCDESSRGRYAADAFIAADGVYADPNINRLELGSNVYSIHLDASATPYSFDTGYRRRYPFHESGESSANGYIRVFMKFTFSEDAGRWYCTDYRQAPITYLSPMYGAKALDQMIDGKPLWVPQSCNATNWEEYIMHTYGECHPLDINPALVSEVTAFRVDEGNVQPCRLAVPYRAVEDGGLGLDAPCNKSGDRFPGTNTHTEHANFWSVRNCVRPASGPDTGAYIPAYEKTSTGWEWVEGGGIISDAVLWGIYDYPTKGEVAYHLPDTEIPDADLTTRRLVYAVRNETNGNIDTGDIQVGPNNRQVLSASYGAERE